MARIAARGGDVAARRRPKTYFTLDPRAIAELEAVGNKSRYVSDLVLQRAAEWRGALDLLLESWPAGEVRRVCEALRVSPGFARDPGRIVREHVEGSVSAVEAHAFLIVAREWWAENSELRERLG